MFRKKKHTEDNVKNKVKTPEEIFDSEEDIKEEKPKSSGKNSASSKTTSQKSSKSKAGRRFNILRSITQILDGSFLTKESAVKLIPFILFLALLGIVYIANSYTAQQKIKEIENINDELKELQNEHKSVKSDLMFYKKSSEVAKRLEPIGVKEPTEPPKKIIIGKEE